MKKDLISVNDLTRDELYELLDRSRKLKEEIRQRRQLELARGRMAVLVFEKPSLRTRVTFETAMRNLGGSAMYLGPADIGMGKRETVADVARNLSRWVDCIIARVFAHSIVEELAREASIPVINALSDDEHPCQTLADLQTILEYRGRLEGANVAWTGDGNNVCNSLMLGCALVGANLRVATPRGFEPPQRFVNQAQAYARQSGATLELLYDPAEAVKGAEFVYTDVWASMGQENETEQRRQIFRPYQLNRSLLALARPDARVLHCLPAHREEEITAEVLDGPQSVVLDQAENRLHAQRALLAALLSLPA
ncbi:MAG: ornithine carbamoyltransferase [candidate division WOR-3 bacterium]